MAAVLACVNYRIFSICLITNNGYCVRFSEESTRPIGRNSQGVTGVRPRDEDFLVALVVVDDTAQLLVASERGLGKRTNFSEYRTKGRGGKGMITMKVTEKTGNVVGGLAVTDEHELMLMTNSGQSVRIPVSQIRETGRNAQGVKLINLSEGEKLQDIARVQKEDDDEVEEEGAEATGAGDGDGEPEALDDAEAKTETDSTPEATGEEE